MVVFSFRLFVFSSLLLSLSGGSLLAQEDEQGDVAIHADARLAVLVRKTHVYVRPTMPEPTPPKPIDMGPKPVIKDSYVGTSGLVHHDVKTVYTGKGFRVQIYNGPSREKAIAAKTEFMRRYPGVRTYLIYVAPGFRVKIGDFRSRGDAEGMLREANSMFTPSMIVPDMVTISTY